MRLAVILIWALFQLSEDPGTLNQESKDLRRKNPEKSFELAKEALRIAELNNQIDQISESLYNLSIASKYLGETTASIAYLNQGLKLDHQHGLDTQFATKANSLGVALKNSGKYDSSLYWHQRALKVRTDLKDSAGMSASFNNIGVTLKYLSFHETALENFQRSLAIKEKLGMVDKATSTRRNVANLFGSLQRFTSAKRHLGENLNYFVNTKDTLNIADSYLGLGTLMLEEARFQTEQTKQVRYQSNEFSLRTSEIGLEKQKLDTVRVLAELSKKLFSEVGSTYDLAFSAQLLGTVLMNEGQYVDASREFIKSLEVFEDYGDALNISTAILNLGILELKRKNYSQARKYLFESYHKAQEIGNLTLKSETLSAMSLFFEGTDNYDLALDFYRSHEYLFYEQLNETKSRQIAELQTKYETEKKDKEIKLQEAEIELTSSKNQKLMLILFTSIGFTLIIIVIYTQRQKAIRKLQKKEQELHEQEVDDLIKDQELKSINSMLEGEEKERKRIAEDLHDRVGSMLSAIKMQSDPSNQPMTKLLDETAEEVRRISHNLETKVLNRFGLVAALDDLAEKINVSDQLTFEVHYLELDERLDNTIEINVYRIVQELVSNALKHSGADEITAQVNRIDQQLIISVEDNGVGFNSTIAKSATGMGLKNVTSRTDELNGHMNIDSGKGNGSIITVEIPL